MKTTLRRTRLLIPLLVVGTVGLAVPHAGQATAAFKKTTVPAASTKEKAGAEEKARGMYERLGLSFEPNTGQAGEGVAYLARTGGARVGIGATEAHFVLPGKENTPGAALRMHLVGANAGAVVSGRGQLKGKVNYLVGNDRARWRTGLPTFSRVVSKGVYPGVDLAWYGRGSQLEYDFVVAPGVDPKGIGFRLDGVTNLRLDGGDLIGDTTAGELRQSAPKLYQKVGSERRTVVGRFVIEGDTVGFVVGDYDRNRTLVIDPTVVYSTYLGGGGNDHGYSVVWGESGSAGEVYVTGSTCSTDFPTLSPVQASFAGNPGCSVGSAGDAFVTKFDGPGGLLFSTYFGGSGADSGNGIAQHLGTGKLFVTGSTTSTNFPTTPGAIQTANGGRQDAFAVQLTSSGSLHSSTYLGGLGDDTGESVAPLDNFYTRMAITGTTTSVNFPTTPGALKPTTDSVCAGPVCDNSDVFYSYLNDADVLLYSTYLGGSGNELAGSIVKDQPYDIMDTDVVIVGTTYSADFPTTPGAYQNVLKGGSDAFLIRLHPALRTTHLPWVPHTVEYSTYLGGAGLEDTAANAQDPNNPENTPANPGGESGLDVAVDDDEGSSNVVYVSGATQSRDFPITTGAIVPNFQCYSRYGCIGFVTAIDTTDDRDPANDLQYSTFIGSGHQTVATTLDVISTGTSTPRTLVVGGYTRSWAWPAKAPLQAHDCNENGNGYHNGTSDAFIVALRPSPGGTAATNLRFSSCLGGTGHDVIYDVSVAPGDSPKVVVVGSTSSPLPLLQNDGTFLSIPFLTTSGAFQSTNAGGFDAFVTKLNLLADL